jgi:hypothetical protein
MRCCLISPQTEEKGTATELDLVRVALLHQQVADDARVERRKLNFRPQYPAHTTTPFNNISKYYY